MPDTRLTRPRDQIRVLLLEGIHERAEEVFRAAGYTSVTRLSDALRGQDLLDAIAKVEMIGIRSRTQLTPEVLEAADRLMAIGCFCIGTNQVALDTAAEKGIPVFHAPHSNTRSVAELVLGLSVMLMRDVHRKSMLAHEGLWRKSAVDSHELRGKTLGIVGYGHIGSQVSILAEAFGLKVIYHDIVPKLTLGNARAMESLDALLQQSDIVSLHVPETAITRGLMNAARLDRMRPGAYLINASRGSVVDVEALAERLKDGRLRGAAVDVFPKEPKSKDETFESPLRGIPNAILTPHVGGSTEEAQEAIGTDVAGQLVAYSDSGATTASVNFPQLALAPHEGGHRVLHIHGNRPGVLSSINDLLADRGVNILGQHLQTRGEVGYVVLDVDEVDAEDILPPLREIGGTIKARVLY
ncbi:MAG TPA: phosphoglycerate dehydrogenase [Longimicrobiales bacterium]|nr:phosphoglycerate dehydrogenase [Longimicrobiales bacterium]